MNLIHDPWIPVKRLSGKVEKIAPWQITETEDPPISLAAPRPDFNGALIQFLIGLMQTARPPTTEEEWEDLLDQPPTPEELKESFEPFAPAFNLTGDGPLFMQEQGLEGKDRHWNHLLIDSSPISAIETNVDHFVHRFQDGSSICKSCAITTLLAMQINAPKGGRGHRTSLRGGGPLTTIIVPSTSQTESTLMLWQTIWRNTMLQPIFNELPGLNASGLDPKIFPWMGPIRLGGGPGAVRTTPLDCSPLQVFWAMPRRIVLLWDEPSEASCRLCGSKETETTGTYVTKHDSTDYAGAWRHPLSPYYDDGEGNWLPLHLQPDGVSYQLWLRVATGSEKYRRAKILDVCQQVFFDSDTLAIWAFGYDMDNMKPRCWYETVYPIYAVPKEVRAEFAVDVEEHVNLSSLVLSALTKNTKRAWFARLEDAKGDYGFLSQSFHAKTEDRFFESVRKMLTLITDDDADAMIQLEKDWFAYLSKTAETMFDYWANRADFAVVDPRRIVEAKRGLLSQLKKIEKGRWVTNV